MLTVVAALIVRDNKLLVCQRRRDDSYGLQWEFPGGKVEPRETPAQALVREIREELDVDASVGTEIYRTTHRYRDTQTELELIFFQARIPDDAMPRNLAFEAFEWSSISALPQYDFLQADKELIGFLVVGWIRLE